MHKRPITVRGVTYPSCKEAALSLGVSPQTVSDARYRGKLETLGLGVIPPKPRLQGKPITIDGITYPSRIAAAKALGIPRHKLYSSKKDKE